MEIGLLLFALGSLTIVNYKIGKSVLYPPFVFSAMWLLVFLVYQANFIAIEPIHAATVILIGLGAITFSVCGWIAWLIPRQVFNIRIKIGDSLGTPRPNHLTKKVLLVFCFIGMLFIAYSTISTGLANGGGGNVLANARSGGGTGDGYQHNPLAAYIVAWTLCTSILFLIEARDRMFWLMFAVGLITAFFSGARVPILWMFIALTSVHLIKVRKLRFLAALKVARVPILIFLLLYVGLIFVFKNTSEMPGGISGIIIYLVVGYVLGPAGGLDYVLLHASDYAYEPNHTFKFLLGLGSKLHLLRYTPAPLLDKFITVPAPGSLFGGIWTNVYTGYKFFFTDYGFIGALVAVGIIGFVQTLVYRKALTGSQLGIYFFAFSMGPLILFVFDDIYSSMGEMLNMVLFGCLYMSVRRFRLLHEIPTVTLHNGDRRKLVVFKKDRLNAVKATLRSASDEAVAEFEAKENERKTERETETVVR